MKILLPIHGREFVSKILCCMIGLESYLNPYSHIMNYE
jgi:hypothetical protein